MINNAFWKGKKVFLTGHTGFKGAWLSLWLHQLGAEVYGYSLPPPTDPNLFDLARVSDLVTTTIADVRDSGRLSSAMQSAAPEIVIHMAAQPLVRESYRSPVETYTTNVMGTVNLLEAVRSCTSVRAVVIVTTDKCYENREWHWGYRENEPMGGYDPYSSSKACAELITSAYRRSFFNSSKPPTLQASKPPTLQPPASIASARAGNVIGGGDWAEDRLICDCIRALLSGEKIIIRNPRAIRPWQHVLEPLSGYLLLARKLYEEGPRYAGAWNFGPNDEDSKTVEWIVGRLCDKWGGKACYEYDATVQPHEAHYLKLDCSKAKAALGWQPRWSLERAIDSTITWVMDYRDGQDVRDISLKQLEQYNC
jgi:CDP-glucose 4,6-dehydratase